MTNKSVQYITSYSYFGYESASCTVIALGLQWKPHSQLLKVSSKPSASLNLVSTLCKLFYKICSTCTKNKTQSGGWEMRT